MGGYLRRVFVGAAAPVAALAFGSFGFPAGEARAACAREDFETVVEQAAGSLRDLNSKNHPLFQEKLRTLKDKRHWTHDEFIEKAKPFVTDDKTAVFDRASDDLLTAIASMGQQGAEAETPDCIRMAELRARMQQLVDTQSAKWAYMFQKLDAELAN